MAEQGEDFNSFCWAFTDGKPLRNDGRQVPAQTPLSAKVSKELKQRGFKFVWSDNCLRLDAGGGHGNDHAQ